MKEGRVSHQDRRRKGMAQDGGAVFRIDLGFMKARWLFSKKDADVKHHRGKVLIDRGTDRRIKSWNGTCFVLIFQVFFLKMNIRETEGTLELGDVVDNLLEGDTIQRSIDAIPL